jgi:hypothetical protein
MAASQHDIITIKNIDDEEFIFEYDRIPQVLAPGEIRRFPRFLAAHGVKHLIDKLLNKRDQKTNNQMLRQELAAEIIIGEEGFAKKPKRTEAEKLKSKLDRMNRPSDLEAVLAKRKRVKSKPEPKTVGEKPDMDKLPKEDEDFEGLEKPKPEPKPKKEAIKPEPKPKPKKEAKPVEDKAETIALPTRAELYTHATDVLGIDVSGKVKSNFDKEPIKKLMKAFDYPLEKLVK